MSTVQPQGESLRKAVQWIDEQRKAKPDVTGPQLADEAAFRFDLSPRDSEFLMRFVKGEQELK
ncbi:MAG: hypothetical protein MI747_17860 [Desulfobacterales bacterium]|nr:hypothetical protein [Desulfobacterales bacterium]